MGAKKHTQWLVIKSIGGLKVEGAILDTNYKSFIGYYPYQLVMV